MCVCVYVCVYICVCVYECVCVCVWICVCVCHNDFRYEHSMKAKTMVVGNSSAFNKQIDLKYILVLES